MKIAMVTWTNNSKILCELLKDTDEIDYAVETDQFLWGIDDQIPHVRIISFGKAFDLYEKGQIDKFLIPYLPGVNVYSLYYLRMLTHKVKEEDIFYSPDAVFKDNNLSREAKIEIICVFKDRNELDQLDISINDHCNLKCANCRKVAGIFSKPSFANFAQTKFGLLRLKKYYNHIHSIFVTGGEPLLNNEVGRYCTFIRDVYPQAEICIITNGTLVLEMKEELLEVLRENDISLKIMYFPVMGSAIDSVNEFLNGKEIRHFITPEITYSNKVYDMSGNNDPKTSFDCCKNRFSSLILRENELASCFAPFAIRQLDEVFHINVRHHSGTVDLLEDGLSSSGIIDRLNRPSEICRFCYKNETPWRTLTGTEKNNLHNWSV